VHAIHPIPFTLGSTHARSHSPSPCHPSAPHSPRMLETPCLLSLKCTGATENNEDDTVGLWLLSQRRKKKGKLLFSLSSTVFSHEKIEKDNNNNKIK